MMLYFLNIYNVFVSKFWLALFDDLMVIFQSG